MTAPGWDVGAALMLGVFVIAPLSRDRLARIRLRHAALLWLLAWAVGLASLFGRKR